MIRRPAANVPAHQSAGLSSTYFNPTSSPDTAEPDVRRPARTRHAAKSEKTAAGEQLLTVGEVAAHCRVDAKTARRWIATKQLAAHKLGRVWRVSERDLRRFLSERWQG